MAQVGCLGDIIFSVDSSKIAIINNARWNGEARYSTHQRHLSNALTEFTGIEPDTFSFDILLSANLGVSVTEELGRIWNYERTGEAVALAIGEKLYGKHRWAIKSHKIKLENYDGGGNLLSAAVSVGLIEYLDS